MSRLRLAIEALVSKQPNPPSKNLTNGANPSAAIAPIFLALAPFSPYPAWHLLLTPMPVLDTKEYSLHDRTSPPVPMLQLYCPIAISSGVTVARSASVAVRVPAETQPLSLGCLPPPHLAKQSVPSSGVNQVHQAIVGVEQMQNLHSVRVNTTPPTALHPASVLHNVVTHKHYGVLTIWHSNQLTSARHLLLRPLAAQQKSSLVTGGQKRRTSCSYS